MSASSHAPAATGAAPWTRFAAEPAPSVRPSAMKISSADTFSAGEHVHHEAARPDAAQVDPGHQPIAASATIACRETVSGTNGSGMTRSGVASFAAGTKRPT